MYDLMRFSECTLGTVVQPENNMGTVKTKINTFIYLWYPTGWGLSRGLAISPQNHYNYTT
jgi:hypothetical protein